MRDSPCGDKFSCLSYLWSGVCCKILIDVDEVNAKRFRIKIFIE